MTCASSEDSDQPGPIPRLICLCWAHKSFCWFCSDAAQFSVAFEPEYSENEVHLTKVRSAYMMHSLVSIGFPNHEVLESLAILGGIRLCG